MGRKGYKDTTYTTTIRSALDEAGGLEELHQELEEWQSNLESNNMEHLPKYEAVQEAVNVLENHGEVASAAQDITSQLEDIGLKCDGCNAVTSILDTQISVGLMEAYKGKGEPRWMRLANAMAPFQAVITFIESATMVPMEKEEEEDGDEKLLAAYRLVMKDNKHGDKLQRAEKKLAKIVMEKRLTALEAKSEEDEEEEDDEVEDIDVSQLESALQEMEAVEFPGMFG